MKLREWQKDGIEFFNNYNNCIMSVTTGAGKSFLAIQIIKKLIKDDNNLKVLIVAPKNVIIENTWLQELHNFGFPINKVGLYNGFSKEFSQITLISIQSLKSLIESSGRYEERDNKYLTTSLIYNSFDMVVFDEVHNYGTDNYQKIIRIEKKYKIGLSATVKREDMKHYKIYEAFGYNIFTYGIEEAIKDKVLNSFDFINIQIPIEEEILEQYNLITDRIKASYHLKDIEKKDNILKKLLNERRQLIYNYPPKFEVVKKIIKDNPKSKILVFNQYNKTSKNLYWELFDINIKADIMNSDIDRTEQGKIFNRFESNETNILLATTMLDEGYNLPKIDIAIIMAANSTEKQFFQRMGRVLRKKDKNSKVFYLTVENTFEEKYLERKIDLIKNISNKYIIEEMEV